MKDFIKQELSSIIQEKLDAMEKRLTSGAWNWIRIRNVFWTFFWTFVIFLSNLLRMY
jgi:hypothetical protein